MKVPFADFSEQYHTIKDEIMPGLDAVFEAGRFILGPEEKQFEEEKRLHGYRRVAMRVLFANNNVYSAVIPEIRRDECR